jgi:hypothetical protein
MGSNFSFPTFVVSMLIFFKTPTLFSIAYVFTINRINPEIIALLAELLLSASSYHPLHSSTIKLEFV